VYRKRQHLASGFGKQQRLLTGNAGIPAGGQWTLPIAGRDAGAPGGCLKRPQIRQQLLRVGKRALFGWFQSTEPAQVIDPGRL